MKQDSPNRNPEPPKYQYRRLKASNSIRLLRLEPSHGFKNATLRGTLKETKTIDYGHFDRQSATYEAVSYAWESQTRERFLMCEGHALPITRNCEDALRRLRKPFTTRLLWIDAICINQDDDAEHAQQVGLMGSIYLDAARVLVWLGKADIHSRTCFRFFRLAKGLVVETDTSKHKSLQQIARRGDVPVEDALRALLKRAWFNRTWVVQEVILAHSVTILCGDQETDARTLLSTVQYFQRQNPELQFPLTFFDNIEILRTALLHSYSFSTQFWGPSVPLNVALQCTRSTLTTDPRDKVYGLLGICKRSKIKPDYSKSPESVFVDATITWYKETHGIAFLRHAGRTKENPKLPSWVPDYGAEGTLPWRGEWGRFSSERVSFFKTSTDRRRIHIQGRAVDLINVCSETTIALPDITDTGKPRAGTSLEQYPYVATWMAWYEFAKTHLPENPEDAIKCAFWWTLYMSSSEMRTDAVNSWHNDVTESISKGKITSELISRANDFAEVSSKTTDGQTDIMSIMHSNTAGCAFGITAGGYPCLMSSPAKAGDAIVSLEGLDELFILRQEGPQFRLVGRCFVHKYKDIYPDGKMSGITLK